jgi:hypothetical protein
MFLQAYYPTSALTLRTLSVKALLFPRLSDDSKSIALWEAKIKTSMEIWWNDADGKPMYWE